MALVEQRQPKTAVFVDQVDNLVEAAASAVGAAEFVIVAFHPATAFRP
jgi:hypothetical protein